MNVYMFDGIVYNGNSVFDFLMFLFRKKKSILKYIFLFGWSFFLYIIGYYEKSQFVKKFWKCLELFEDKQGIAVEFWQKNRHKINRWYSERKRPQDFVVSYLPYFVTEYILKDINIIDGVSVCEEEIIAIIKENGKIENFYSSVKEADKISAEAEESFIVKNGVNVKRNEYKASLIETVFSRAFISFAFIGVVNTSNTIIFSAIFSCVLNPNLSFALGYFCSLSVNYILNSKITFKETLAFAKYIKFCMSYIPNFIIQKVIVIIFYNGFGWNEILVYTLAGVIGIPVTFLILKIFTFKEKKE